MRRALALGAVREAPQRAELALARLAHLRDHVVIVTCPGEMGEDEARACGFEPARDRGPDGRPLGRAAAPFCPTAPRSTTPDDTVAAARALRDTGVDLLLFAGGDGTARDVCGAVGGGARLPWCAGRGEDPFSGLRDHSGQRRRARRALPARSPRGSASARGRGHGRRRGRLSKRPRLGPPLRLPAGALRAHPFLQSAKAGGCAGDAGDLRAIAADVVGGMTPGAGLPAWPRHHPARRRRGARPGQDAARCRRRARPTV